MARKRSTAAAKLAAYRAKRDFRTSPEPTGAKGKSRRAGSTTNAKKKKNAVAKVKPKGDIWQQATPPRFCVQKHLASQLHYDFRLEHGGVLLSWAVPEGPSLNPADKRLAMKVEDHPLDYGGFEGVIPSGYGAGVVVLWDVGSWKPEDSDVDAALARGDMKFRLEGVKLKGSWALVHIKGKNGRHDEGRNWLLIKHRDEWSGEVDVTAAAPLSVKSFGDFPDILAADDPPEWASDRPASVGKTSALLDEVIEQAAARKAGRVRGRGRRKTQ